MKQNHDGSNYVAFILLVNPYLLGKRRFRRKFKVSKIKGEDAAVT